MRTQNKQWHVDTAGRVLCWETMHWWEFRSIGCNEANTNNPDDFQFVFLLYCTYRLKISSLKIVSTCVYGTRYLLISQLGCSAPVAKVYRYRTYLYQKAKYWIFLANLHTSQGHALPSSQHIISRKAISLPLNIQILTFSAWATTRQIKIKLCSPSR